MSIPTIGILALQGAFLEHHTVLSSLLPPYSCDPTFVRSTSDLLQCDALIIPGGESTTIGLLAKESGLLDVLKGWDKPIWGTCAGAILLASTVENVKEGGQELIGGLDMHIRRNGYGSQIASFSAPISVSSLSSPDETFDAIFIRAPIIMSTGPEVEVLAELEDHPVVVRQGNRMVSTFHPELSGEERFHRFFVEEFVLPGLKA